MEDELAPAAAGGARRGAGGRSPDTGEERDGGPTRAWAPCGLGDSAATHPPLCTAHSSTYPFAPPFSQALTPGFRLLEFHTPFLPFVFISGLYLPLCPDPCTFVHCGTCSPSLHSSQCPRTSVHPPCQSRLPVSLQDFLPDLQPMQLHPGRS